MSAGITQTDSMVSGRNMVPWHKLGKVVKGLMTFEQVLSEAGITWLVSKEPVTRNGKVVPGAFFTVRSDINSVLGIVGDRYTVVQNSQGLDILEALVGTGDAIYDTAGSLHGGRKVWIMAKPVKGTFWVKDEEYESYMLFSNSHDGSSGVTVANVTVRVVCQNTLAAAIGGAKKIVSVRHTRTAEDRLKEAHKLLDINTEYVEAMKATAQKLVKAKVTEDEFTKFLNTLVPIPTVEKGGPTRGKTIAENVQSTIKGLYFNADNLANIRGTKWGVYNAVVEYNDHVVPGRNTAKDGDNRLDNAFERVLLESNIGNRALDLLLA